MLWIINSDEIGFFYFFRFFCFFFYAVLFDDLYGLYHDPPSNNGNDLLHLWSTGEYFNNHCMY